MTQVLGADFDKLRGSAFAPSQAAARAIEEQFVNNVRAAMPLTTREGSKEDKEIVALVESFNRGAAQMFELLGLVAGGRSEAVDALRELVSRAEEANTVNANGSGRH